MPQIRPGRVRTKNTSRRKPLLLSTMNPQDFNVREGEVKSIACPDCRTWRRVMNEKKLKVRHHPGSERHAVGEKHAECPGSYRVVVVDIDVRKWQRRSDQLLKDGMWPDLRRVPRQHYKPIPEPAPSVHQMSAPPAPSALEIARRSLKAHCERCKSCTSTYCPVGMGLVGVYLRRLHSRPEQWQAASRSATRADKQRAQRPYGNRPADAPRVPREPLTFPVSSAPAAKFARRAYKDHQTRCSVCTSDQQCPDAQRLERALKRAAAAVA